MPKSNSVSCARCLLVRVKDDVSAGGLFSHATYEATQHVGGADIPVLSHQL